MRPLDVCASCGGFVPAEDARCPHCDLGDDRSAGTSRAVRAVSIVAGLLGGGAFAMTLMACYGAPMPAHREPGHPTPEGEPTPNGTTSGSPAPSMSAIDPPGASSATPKAM